jgi:outer membrane protein assembly factor BamC
MSQGILISARGAGSWSLAVGTLLLSGCLSMNSTDAEYKSRDVAKGPQLEVPPDLTRPGRDDRYVVPEPVAGGTAVSASSYGKGPAPTVAQRDSGVLPEAGQMVIQRSGTERWLVVPQAPEALWPVVREFWQQNGFLLKVEAPELGIIETDWAENHAKLPGGAIRDLLGRYLDTVYSTGERDKYRTRLERGAQPGTTEVYISHRGMVEKPVVTPGGNEGKTLWEPRPSDTGLESEFLRRLMVRLGSDDLKARAVVAASTAAQTDADRARIVSGTPDQPYLQVNDPLDRAWRRVGLVLDRVGFSVEDRDRAAGQYRVRFVDLNENEAPKKSGGFLSSLAFWRDDTKKPTAEQYRIQLRQGADQMTEVRVLDKDGQPDRTPAASRILSLLQAQLR